MLRSILLCLLLLPAVPARASNPLPAPPDLSAANVEPLHWQVDVSFGVDLDEPGILLARVCIWVRTSPDGPPEAVAAWSVDDSGASLPELLPAALRASEGWAE